ncbi:hypothetical protein [uncultured Winogradskyella sp.]|uniref:hypothetical protein n=1 Tax=uncultured Winogradskyella sp. TaxID=395353 RepID=UPI003511E8FE
MSDKSKEIRQNEEIDLILIFNLLGRFIKRVFNKIIDLFKGIFHVIILLLKPVVDNFKLISIVVFSSFILGFIAEKLTPTVYFSDMLVKPYFESKYQLANNVNYFNALISSNNLEELSNIFEIDTVSAGNLIGFELEIGPETQNDLLLEYDTYIKSIDSALAAEVTYEEFLENRDILAGSIFSIMAKAYTPEIFPKLEKGFRKTFENEYSKKLKKIRDSTLLIEKIQVKNEIKKVDSLQQIYFKVLINESEKKTPTMTGSSLIPMVNEKTVTREYELFQEELKMRKSLRNIEEKLIQESEYYDVLAGFEARGSTYSDIWQKYSLLLPALSFIIMVILFGAFKAFNFIKNYE